MKKLLFVISCKRWNEFWVVREKEGRNRVGVGVGQLKEGENL